MTHLHAPPAEAVEFRKRLHRAPARASSPAAIYTAAAAASLIGFVSIFGAESQPIFISGFLIVGASIAAAVWTRWVSRRTAR